MGFYLLLAFWGELAAVHSTSLEGTAGDPVPAWGQHLPWDEQDKPNPIPGRAGAGLSIWEIIFVLLYPTCS